MTRSYEQTRGDDPVFRTKRLENAGEVTLGGMARQMDLEKYDRLCYPYDYSNKWRSYAILKDVLSDEPDDMEPAVVNTEGEAIDQYGSSRWRRF